MRIEAELTEDQLDEITAARLNYLADNMENYLHAAEVPLKGDIKDYKMLIRAANYFKVPNEQRKPLKFVARKRADDLVRKKGRKHKEDAVYSEGGPDTEREWDFWKP